MAMQLRDVIRYFVQNYPYSDDLTKTRLTKMVYLTDWFSAQQNKRTVTDIVWFFDHYGPYVTDVIDCASRDKELKVKSSSTVYGTPKTLIATKHPEASIDIPSLNDDDERLMQKVIDETKNFSWTKFIDYVYSTWPFVTQQRYSELDLVKLAREEEEEIEAFLSN